MRHQIFILRESSSQILVGDIRLHLLAERTTDLAPTPISQSTISLRAVEGREVGAASPRKRNGSLMSAFVLHMSTPTIRSVVRHHLATRILAGKQASSLL